MQPFDWLNVRYPAYYAPALPVYTNKEAKESLFARRDKGIDRLSRVSILHVLRRIRPAFVNPGVQAKRQS